MYKKLLREEREQLEDERKAAIEIQRYNLDYNSYCIHAGLFPPCVIFVLLHLQMFSPRLEFAQMKLCLREII